MEILFTSFERSKEIYLMPGGRGDLRPMAAIDMNVLMLQPPSGGKKYTYERLPAAKMKHIYFYYKCAL